jgi:uncharacterized Fe-S cluster-containing radical SAM superfamily protein
MYDPIELSYKVEKLVVKNSLKKYYRFRPTGFYGGIATADTVGCNLRCAFCWSGNSVWNTEKTGKFYTSKQVVESLYSTSREKGYSKVRISGGEPTIGRKHLIEILRMIDSKLLFILETNGLLLGYNKNYVEELSSFKNIHIRVCLKGSNAKEFQILTGAKNGFEYQMKALEYLRDEKVNFNIAIVSVTSDKQKLFQHFIEMGLDDVMIEHEEIKLYPMVRKRLKKQNLLKYF